MRLGAWTIRLWCTFQGRAPKIAVQTFVEMPLDAEAFLRLIRDDASAGTSALSSSQSLSMDTAQTVGRDAPGPASDPCGTFLGRFLNQDLGRLNHFQMLELGRTPTRREVLGAYLEVARRFHPNVAASLGNESLAQEMAAVYRRATEAWHELSDNQRRVTYAARLSPANG
jgi:hypothetical protein